MLCYRIYKDFQRKLATCQPTFWFVNVLEACPCRFTSLATTKLKLGVTIVMWDFHRLLVYLTIIPFSFWVRNLFSKILYNQRKKHNLCVEYFFIICWQTNIQIFNAMCGPKLCNKNKKVCDVVKLKSPCCANAQAR
jgi:hypothetical protein